MAVKPVPKGYHTVTPYLIVTGAKEVLEFVKRAFGAEVQIAMSFPDGKIGHAEATIGDSKVMVAEANERWPAMPASVYLYVDDVDTTYRKALQAGGQSLMEPADQFYGDRHGGVKDAAGNNWWIASHIEDVSEEELQRRIESFHVEPKE